MTNKPVILSAGDSFSTFKTPDCEKLHHESEFPHAVELVAKHYGAEAMSCGFSGSGIQDGVIRTLDAINNNPDVCLLFFHITMYSRWPAERREHRNLIEKLDGLKDFKSISDIPDISNLMNLFVDIDQDTEINRYVEQIPTFKINFDNIAYLNLLVQVCRNRGIGVIFISEFMPVKEKWHDLNDLFAKDEHVKVADNFLCESLPIDPSSHRLYRLQFNHICQHFQDALSKKYLELYDEFMGKYVH